MKVARRGFGGALFACSLLLSGCWDNHELEDLAFVTVVGLDAAPNNNLRITYMYLTPPAEDPKHRESNRRPLTTSFLVPTFGSAPMVASITTDRIITAQQVKALIVSEDLARREDILPMIDGMVRERAYRRDIVLITCLNSTGAFMKANQSKLGSNSLTYIENMRHQYRNTGLFPEVTLNDFLIATETGDELAWMGLAAIAPGNADADAEKSVAGEGDEFPGSIHKRGGDNRLQFSGAAVYRGGREIGRMTGQEVRSALLLRGDAGSFIQTMRDPYNPQRNDTIQVFQVLFPKVRSTLQGGRLFFRIDVNLYGALSSDTSQTDYAQTMPTRKKLTKAFERMMSRGMEQLLDRSQREFGGDICQLERTVRWKFWTEQDWSRFNYTRHFKTAQFRIRVHVHLKEFGKQRYVAGR